MPQQRLIVSTVGTSLLTNAANDAPADRARINKITNDQTLAPEDARLTQMYADKALDALLSGSIAAVRKASAELNGILAFYDDQVAAGAGDTHLLIATDTAIGKQCAQLVKEYLESQGIANVQTYFPEHLDTSNSRRYQDGIRHLAHYCATTLPEYRDSKYAIIFNLNGGFKSLQGYMTTLGMFYADEMIYLFEGEGAQLLRIPRLPIVLDQAGIREHADAFALLFDGDTLVNKALVAGVSPLFYEMDDGGDEVMGTTWGEVMWSQARDAIYQESLLAFPRLVYLESFRRDFKDRQPRERVLLQTKLAYIAGLLERFNGDKAALARDTGARYAPLENKYDPDKRQIDHFRVNRELRVTCVYEQGTLLLRRFDHHRIDDTP